MLSQMQKRTTLEITKGRLPQFWPCSALLMLKEQLASSVMKRKYILYPCPTPWPPFSPALYVPVAVSKCCG